MNKHHKPHRSILTEKKIQKIEWSFEDIDEVFVIGGDGTLFHTVNMLPDLDLPINIVPNGLGNDFAKNLNIKKNNGLMESLIISDRTIETDAGFCNGQYFLNGMGMGMDGEVVWQKNNQKFWFRTPLIYSYLVFKKLFGYDERTINYKIDGTDYQKKLLLLTVANGTTFGGGFQITPNANVSDGYFEICEITSVSRFRRFLEIHRLGLGTHDSQKEVRFLRAKEIFIEGQPDLKFHLDGESFQGESLQISMVPKKFKFKIPAPS